MKTWIRKRFDTAEHTRDTIAVGAVVAGLLSLALFMIVAVRLHQ